MNTPPQNRRLIWLVIASFAAFAASLVLYLGITNTPDQTTDSMGRTMGFNDRLSPEHYGIILKNFTLIPFFSPDYGYEWLLLATHLTAAWLLWTHRSSSPFARWFFTVQPFLFPLGFLFSLALYPIYYDFLTGRMDREGIIDIPFIWCVAHPAWVLASTVIALILWTNRPTKAKLTQSSIG